MGLGFLDNQNITFKLKQTIMTTKLVKETIERTLNELQEEVEKTNGNI